MPLGTWATQGDRRVSRVLHAATRSGALALTAAIKRSERFATEFSMRGNPQHRRAPGALRPTRGKVPGLFSSEAASPWGVHRYVNAPWRSIRAAGLVSPTRRSAGLARGG
jgi:hypothetical protein